jgi:hypothetical protein
VGPDSNFRHFALLVTTFAVDGVDRSPADPTGTGIRMDERDALREHRKEGDAWVMSQRDVTSTAWA